MNYDEQEQNMGNTVFNNQYTAESVLKIRLDTVPLLQKMETYLRGSETFVTEDEKGRIISKKISTGKSKCNESGVQSILIKCQMILNSQVVQGNYDKDYYRDEICRIRKSIARDVMINLLDWDVRVEDYSGIVDDLMNAIKPFLSRLIDNKERDSYANTIRHIENSRVQQSGSGGMSSWIPFKK